MLIRRSPLVCPVCGLPSLRLVDCRIEQEPTNFLCSSCQESLRYVGYQWFCLQKKERESPELTCTSHRTRKKPNEHVVPLQPITWRFAASFPPALGHQLIERCTEYLLAHWRRLPPRDGPEYALDPYAEGVLGILIHELSECPSVKAHSTPFLWSLIGHGLCMLQAWDATLEDREHPTRAQCEQISDRIVRMYSAQLCPHSLLVCRPKERDDQ